MIIKKSINFPNICFDAITDDTTQITKSCLFVQTKLNARYTRNLPLCPLDSYTHNPQAIAYIESKNLAQIFSLPKYIVGITGTNGKTTTAACISSILLDCGFRVAVLGTRGFFINEREIKPKGLTTPSVLELYEDFELAKDCDFFIMEVSSHAIVQERIIGVPFFLKLLSNITSDHLDFHETLNEYIRVKNSFFRDTELKVINADEANASFESTNAYTYAITKEANLNVTTFSLQDGISAHLESKIGQISENALLTSPLLGKHNLYNLLCALCACKILSQNIQTNTGGFKDLSLQDFCNKVQKFRGVSGRMEVVSENPLVIVDFAHTPDGMEQIFASFQGKKIVVLFGAGGNRDKSKRPKMGAIAQAYANKIYLTSDNPRDEDPLAIIEQIAQGIDTQQALIIEPDRAKAIKLALRDLQQDEILLVLGKGDETSQIIGDAICNFDDREVIKNLLATL